MCVFLHCGILCCSGNPLDVLSGNAKGEILAAHVVGLGEDELIVMGSKCLKIDVEGGSTDSITIRLSSCDQPNPQPRPAITIAVVATSKRQDTLICVRLVATRPVAIIFHDAYAYSLAACCFVLLQMIRLSLCRGVYSVISLYVLANDVTCFVQ